MLLILYTTILFLILIVIIWLLQILYNVDYYYQLEYGCMTTSKS